MFRGYRIGFQGGYSDSQFIFKARADSEIIHIDESTKVFCDKDKNRFAQILMFRFADSYIREYHPDRETMRMNKVIRILLNVCKINSEHDIYWDSMGCSTRVLKLLYIKKHYK